MKPTQAVPTYRAQQPNRYTDGRRAELTPPDAWRRCALGATTRDELEDIARSAQRSGHWAEGDAPWMRLLRQALLDNDPYALQLLTRVLGAVEIAGGAS